MPFSRLVVLGLLLLLTFSFAGCGGSNLLTSIDISPCPQAAPSGSTSVPAANHVFLVVDENASYLLVSLSKTPRIEILLRPKTVPETFPIKASDNTEATKEVSNHPSIHVELGLVNLHSSELNFRP